MVLSFQRQVVLQRLPRKPNKVQGDVVAAWSQVSARPLLWNSGRRTGSRLLSSRVLSEMPKVGHIGRKLSNRWMGKFEHSPPSDIQHSRMPGFGPCCTAYSGTAEINRGKLIASRAATMTGMSATGNCR